MEDDQILDLFWSRSDSALVQMQKKYGKLLVRIASNILPDARDAEEAVSDTYLRLWNSIPPKRPEHLMAYSIRICRNLSIDLLRKGQNQKQDRRCEILFSELEECLTSSRSVSEGVEERELMAMISRYLDILEPSTRILFVRRYFGMEELQQLADSFGLSRHAVSARLYRARRGLKAYLEKEGIAV